MKYISRQSVHKYSNIVNRCMFLNYYFFKSCKIRKESLAEQQKKVKKCLDSRNIRSINFKLVSKSMCNKNSTHN